MQASIESHLTSLLKKIAAHSESEIKKREKELEESKLRAEGTKTTNALKEKGGPQDKGLTDTNVLNAAVQIDTLKTSGSDKTEGSSAQSSRPHSISSTANAFTGGLGIQQKNAHDSVQPFPPPWSKEDPLGDDHS